MFSSYLEGRTQTTQIGSYVSNKAKINCGVPQGSVLGPLLFLIYINDISYCSDKFQFYLFADDTNLLYADKNLNSLESIVNQELENVYNWLTSNKLTLNIKKSNYVIFHPYQKKFLSNPKYSSLIIQKKGKFPLKARNMLSILEFLSIRICLGKTISITFQRKSVDP